MVKTKKEEGETKPEDKKEKKEKKAGEKRTSSESKKGEKEKEKSKSKNKKQKTEENKEIDSQSTKDESPEKLECTDASCTANTNNEITESQKEKKKEKKKKEKAEKPKTEKQLEKEKKDALIMNEDVTKETVSKLMLTKNRPYSAKCIFALHQRSMKIQNIEKALEDLTAENVITMKDYGKSKVYLANQDKFGEVDEDQLYAMDNQILDRKNELEEITTKQKKQNDQMAELNKSYSNEQMVTMIDKLTQEVTEMKERLINYKAGNQEVLSEEQINQIHKESKHCLNNWKKQKTIAKELIDEVSEQANMNFNQFVRDLGLETDEDYGIDYCEIMGLKKK